MYELDAIETINVDQLTTAMDRLLLHRGRLPQHRLHPEPSPAERTVLVRPRRSVRPRRLAPPRRHDFDAQTIVVSSLVSCALFLLVTLLALG
ncbi:MAG TPA: hypothetical protein VNO30_45555 [Kofleriaceae bacterium]|nr:hypothetical protein [Kofleriaceae bacterium]